MNKIEIEQPGRRMADKNAAYLSGSASIKDDLQAIYTLNKEIGAAVWTVFTHLESLKVVLTKQIPESYNEVEAKLELLLRTVDTLRTEHGQLSKRMEALDSLKATAQNNADMLEEQEHLQASRQVHFDRIIRIIYTANGYDESGIKVPEAILRFDRWSKIIHNAFWSFIVTAMMSGIFYMYAKGQAAAAEEKTKAVLELIQKTKETMEYNKADAAEQERRNQIIADHDAAVAGQVIRNKEQGDRNSRAIKRYNPVIQHNTEAIKELEKK